MKSLQGNFVPGIYTPIRSAIPAESLCKSCANVLDDCKSLKNRLTETNLNGLVITTSCASFKDVERNSYYTNAT